MPDTESAKDFWEQKILHWERSRYSPRRALNPLAWTVRGRLREAAGIIMERVPPAGSILELGCGSGYLAEKLAGHCANYIGVDIAENAVAVARERGLPSEFVFHADDVAQMQVPWADLTVFLGLSDWLSNDHFYSLLGRLRSPEVLFSYTEDFLWSPYRLYRRWADGGAKEDHRRARTYTQQRIESMLSATNFTMELLVKPAPHNPGGLVWARKI